MQPMLPGQLYRRTHQSSVDTILGRDAPRVTSKGDRFYNADRWVINVLVKEICNHAPWTPLTEEQACRWMKAANDYEVTNREIVIASTPDKLPLQTAMALIGGAYHEAWHTLYSRRRDFKLRPLMEIFEPRWPLFKRWSKIESLWRSWINVIEDIRIERRGNDEFPGAYEKMVDLQDFILGQELDSRESWNDMSAITGTFRDIGLGYDSPLQRESLEIYEKDFTKAYKIVTEGVLKPLLEQAMDPRNADDDTLCLWLAMDVIIALSPSFKDQPPEPKPQHKGSGRPQESSGDKSGQDSQDKETEGVRLSSQDDVKTKDNASALGQAIDEAINQNVQAGEKPWRPHDTSHDEVKDFEGRGAGGGRSQTPSYNEALTAQMYKEARQAVSGCQARLRRILQARQVSKTYHGVPRGRILSGRMLTDTITSLKAKEMPRRAYTRKITGQKLSAVVVIVVDQSGSMKKALNSTAKAALGIAHLMETVRCPTLVAGFRTNYVRGRVASVNTQKYHRTHGVKIDVFKKFNTKLASCLPNFGYMTASGGTPMADGIQFGLHQLLQRKETHRILLVITDGRPDPRQAPVVTHQVRRAPQHGIQLVGVGIGKEASYVQQVFEHHLHVMKFKDLPLELLAHLGRILGVS